MGLFFLQGIGAILREAGLGLGAAQALGATGQVGKEILGALFLGLITGNDG